VTRGGNQAFIHSSFVIPACLRISARREISMSSPCEQIVPYGELWRSLTDPSRAYSETCLPEAVKR